MTTEKITSAKELGFSFSSPETKRVLKPPFVLESYPSEKGSKIFLAGSIEMNKARDWQRDAEKILNRGYGNHELCLFNPRRDDWDSSWKQGKDEPEFRGQVLWELDHLDKCDFILLYLQPETMSPISLLELGIYASESPEKLRVVCPEGFWRKGNVDIVCEKYKVKQFDSIEEACEDIISTLKTN